MGKMFFVPAPGTEANHGCPRPELLPEPVCVRVCQAKRCLKKGAAQCPCDWAAR